MNHLARHVTHGTEHATNDEQDESVVFTILETVDYVVMLETQQANANEAYFRMQISLET